MVVEATSMFAASLVVVQIAVVEKIEVVAVAVVVAVGVGAV